ncbi:MAG: hypothetical protein HY794_01590 [Desulfarculus sp.]|nr:hypothetical protein [Desulfarculus sp.]
MIEGYRFVCSPGGKPCDLCAAHCGQEYVHEPRAGQHPIEERPDPPMHPNCRCKLELITNTLHFVFASGPGPQTAADIHDINPSDPWEVNFTTPGLSDYFNTGRIGRFDLVYCTDGRDENDGPTYGNFGGQGWRFGRNESKIPELASQAGLTVDEWLAENYKPPIDSLDSIFEDHDYCYGQAEGQAFYSQAKLECDKELIEAMRTLDDDPQNWPDAPKADADIEYARKFHCAALNLFEAKGDYAKLRSKYGEEYMNNKYFMLKWFLESN